MGITPFFGSGSARDFSFGDVTAAVIPGAAGVQGDFRPVEQAIQGDGAGLSRKNPFEPGNRHGRPGATGCRAPVSPTAIQGAVFEPAGRTA